VPAQIEEEVRESVSIELMEVVDRFSGFILAGADR
jgi:hypothetical protein